MTRTQPTDPAAGRHSAEAALVDESGSTGSGWVRAAVWMPGLAVALGAAVATAHGLYEVAAAATVPTVIAWLYPLITDGLALVAYTATARLAGSARRYAWAVVVLAAGLSGLAQASYLASADTVGGTNGSAAFEVSAGLRFGIGAWPAIAAAVVAHLLYLLAESSRPAAPDGRGEAPPRSAFNGDRSTAAVQPELFKPAGGQRIEHPAGLNAPLSLVASRDSVEDDVELDAFNESAPSDRPGAGSEHAAEAPARDRAREAAAQHVARHGALPTVSELETAAGVSRGTAAAVLKTLRRHPSQPRKTSTSAPHQREERDQP
jgi:hypothetical protein